MVFQDELKETARKFNLHTGIFIQSPIQELKGFHLPENVSAFSHERKDIWKSLENQIIFNTLHSDSEYLTINKIIMKNFRIEAIILAIGLLLLGVFIEKDSVSLQKRPQYHRKRTGRNRSTCQ